MRGAASRAGKDVITQSHTLKGSQNMTDLRSVLCEITSHLRQHFEDKAANVHNRIHSGIHVDPTCRAVMQQLLGTAANRADIAGTRIAGCSSYTPREKQPDGQSDGTPALAKV